jgi:hypothetical protein
MKILAASVIVFAAAFVVHLLVWRVALPRRQTRALGAIFAAVWIAALAASAWFFLPDVFSVCYASLLYWSAAAAYIVTYSAMEGDSPTLSLVRHLDRAGPGGITHAELEMFFAQRPFAAARLRALVEDGILSAGEGGYRLRGQRPFLFCLVLGFRRAVLGRAARGG